MEGDFILARRPVSDMAVQNALKSVEKSLARLRTLIQKYYLSHPACRFSLRIMASPQKGKGGGSKSEDKVYAPSKTVTEAVLKAVGKDVAAACQWITTSDTNITKDAGHEGGNDPDTGTWSIRIDALLPRPDIDPTIVCKKPQCTHFVYIDDRPVSCARGTLKQILTLYKSYLKSAFPSTSNISDPFVFLNLHCPPGTYDPNIEPAKDDVLFFNIAGVLGAVEMLL
jgi:DNA mismatch repair ATPase MutL